MWWPPLRIARALQAQKGGASFPSIHIKSCSISPNVGSFSSVSLLNIPDPTNQGFGNPLVLTLLTRFADPYVHVVFLAPVLASQSLTSQVDATSAGEEGGRSICDREASRRTTRTAIPVPRGSKYPNIMVLGPTNHSGYSIQGKKVHGGSSRVDIDEVGPLERQLPSMILL